MMTIKMTWGELVERSKYIALKNKISLILSRKKPALICKLAILKTNILIGRVPPFRQVEIQTSFACNLRCTHCSATAFEENSGVLEISDYESIAKQCKEHKVPMISFTGGEPLYDNRLEQIISVFDTKSTLVSITTNGVLLTEERAQKLKAIGVDSLVISLDGSNPMANDTIRGHGTFERVMRSIGIAKRHKFFLLIINTLTHQSVQSGEFDRMINLAEGIDVPLHVSLAAPVGNWASAEAMKDFILTTEDVEYWLNCKKKYTFLRRDLDGNYCGVGCPAGTERFVISPIGDVMPCTKIQAKFGNIKSEQMIDIRNRMAGINILKESPPRCIVAEDKMFLDVYMPKLYGRHDLPIDYREFFQRN